MRREIATAIAVFVCTSSAWAQLSGYTEILGTGGNAVVQLNLYERFGTGAEFPDDCVIQEVRSGSPTGPLVWESILCNDVPVPVPAWGQATGTWNMLTTGGWSVSDGRYFLMTRSRQNLAGAQLTEQWFPVTLARRGIGPLLVGSPFLSEGSPHAYIVNAPAHAGMPYIAAASSSTQAGSTLFGGHLTIALDQDTLFFDTLANPNTSPYWQLQGTLDSTGNAAFGVMIPVGLPSLLHHANVHVQVLIWDGSGAHTLSPAVTNVSSGVLFLTNP